MNVEGGALWNPMDRVAEEGMPPVKLELLREEAGITSEHFTSRSDRRPTGRGGALASGVETTGRVF